MLRILLILTMLATASTASAGQRYYMVMFGSQDCGLNWPRNSHTFVTFVRVKECNGVPVSDSWDQFTISWLPCSLDVNILKGPEPGMNLDLHATLDFYKDCGETYYWGPYEVCPELYRRAVKQFKRLESGNVQYRALDLMFAEGVDNCIHSVGGASEPHLRFVSGTTRGAEASRLLVLRMNKWITSKTAPEEISLRLGLDAYRIHAQPFPYPTPVRSSLRRLLLVAPQLSLEE